MRRSKAGFKISTLSIISRDERKRSQKGTARQLFHLVSTSRTTERVFVLVSRHRSRSSSPRSDP